MSEDGGVRGSERLTCLDGLRGLLALLVVLSHTCDVLPCCAGAGVLLARWRVPAFFALSGFVLYLSSAREPEIGLKVPFRDFLVRRSLRLLPAYYAALSLTFLTLQALVQAGLVSPRLVGPREGLSFLLHLAFLHTWHGDAAVVLGVIAPAWMMGYEWQLSLLTPLFLRVARWGGWPLLLGFGLALQTPCAQEINRRFFHPTYTLAFLAGLFAVRMARQRLDASHLWSVEARTRCAAVVAACAAIGAAYAWHSGIHCGGSLSECLVGITTAALCAVMTLQSRSGIARLLSARPLVWVGTISYSLFLIHSPVLRLGGYLLARFQIHSGLGVAAVVTGSLVVALALALLLYSLFERPFRRVPTSETA